MIRATFRATTCPGSGGGGFGCPNVVPNICCINYLKNVK